MNLKEAVSVLKNAAFLGTEEDRRKIEEALTVIEEALTNDGDTISRQAVIKAFDGELTVTGKDNAETVKDYLVSIEQKINNLPSAQPEDYTEMKREFLRMASYIDVLLECSDKQKETLLGFISRMSEYMPWYEDDDFEVKERTETHSCDYGRKETHGDKIKDMKQYVIEINKKQKIKGFSVHFDTDTLGGQSYYVPVDKVKTFVQSDVPDTNVGDTISRQVAIDAVHRNYDTIIDFRSDGETVATSVEDILIMLPSAQPERKKGEWYKPTGMMPPEYAGVYRCSECDGIAMRDYKTHKQTLTDFCPNCGADMRGEHE